MADLWSVKRVAEYLGVSERTVYERVRSGELPAVRIGRVWRVRPDDVEDWLARSTGASLLRERGHGRAELEAELAGVENMLERRLVFVGVLSSAMEAQGRRPPVIVGGNAVEFYTVGGYATADIDLVAATDAVDAVLSEWGFERVGRHWIDESLGLVVEAPGAQLSADETAHVVEVQVGRHVTRVLGVEDLIVDRLNACVHWQDQESCDWARQLLRSHRDRIDPDYLRRRATEEDAAAELERSIEEAWS